MPGEPQLACRPIAGRGVHRRHHVKPDGRDVFLYDYKPHDGPLVTGEELAMLAGSELRYHPLRGEWALYAAQRQNRTFKPSAADDPLAPSTPSKPLTEIPFEDFELAVFSNRFPGLHAASPPPQAGPVKTMAGTGACDVIVYASEATGSLATLGQARRRLLIEAWVDRYAALFTQGCRYVLPFENRGEAVGVTLHHPHGQIYGLPIIPEPQKRAADAFETGYDLAAEMRGWGKAYEVCQAGGLHAVVPPFMRFPYEVWIAADSPVSGPWALNEEQSDGFAHLLGEMTERYDTFFGQPTPYMLSLHAAPDGRDGPFQFTAQFYPLLRAPGRVKYLAAVEQATGLFTVDVMPDQAAQRLRDAL